MKPLPVMISAVWLASLILAACAPKTPPQKIRITTAATYPPFESVDYGKRQLTGFDIELMQAIAARENLEVEFADMGYDQALAGVTDCQYDGAIAAIAVTEPLKQQVSFSEPYTAVGQVVVVKKGNTAITGRDSLVGATVGVQKGTQGASLAAQFNGTILKSYDLYSQEFQDLIYGEIDAVIAERTLALSYVNKPANNLKIAGDEFAIENYAIAVCSKEPDLLKKINAGLAAVKSNGSLDKLVKKWLANPIIQ